MVLPQSKFFVNFVNFQVVSILLILIFDLKSCFYVYFNLFEWSQVEEIARKLKGKESDRNRSKNRAKNRALRDFAASAKSALCCKTILQHFGVLYENFRSCEGDFGTWVPLRSTGALIWQLRNALRSGKAQISHQKSYSAGYFAIAKVILAHVCHFATQWY